MIKPSNLHYNATSWGFTLFFKGHNIGETRFETFHEYHVSNRMAKRERDMILLGHGSTQFVTEMERIGI